MRKNLLLISLCGILCVALAGLSGCYPEVGIRPLPAKKKGIVAIVFSDLTKSIDDETAKRQKENIGQLFQKLPPETKFYLYSIDRGTNKPHIYEFAPEFKPIITTKEQEEEEVEKAKAKQAKETTELEKLNSSLGSYQASITRQNGPVSCIANKLNWLLDTIKNKEASFGGYEIRVFFYSDMIEQCQHSFDDKPANFERHPNNDEEAKRLEDIKKRIEQHFGPTSHEKNLKSMGTKIYIVLTSQEDKQSPKNLKTIWNTFFEKLGFKPEDLVWSNGNEPFFWMFEKPKM